MKRMETIIIYSSKYGYTVNVNEFLYHLIMNLFTSSDHESVYHSGKFDYEFVYH